MNLEEKRNHEISQLRRVRAFLRPRVGAEAESAELSRERQTQAGRVHQKNHRQRFESKRRSLHGQRANVLRQRIESSRFDSTLFLRQERGQQSERNNGLRRRRRRISQLKNRNKNENGEISPFFYCIILMEGVDL